MPVTVSIDDDLIEEARRVGRHRSSRAAATAALREYIQRRRQAEIVTLFGTVEYDAQYDYKVERQRNSN